MHSVYASDKQFWSENDSQTIQNAVDFAERTGAGRVIIPRLNLRTGESIWNISTDGKIPMDAMKGLRFENVTVVGGKHVFRGPEQSVTNLQYRDISVSYRTDEPLNIPSAYARYHRCYNGKVMTNRPADSRYDETGNLKK